MACLNMYSTPTPSDILQTKSLSAFLYITKLPNYTSLFHKLIFFIIFCVRRKDEKELIQKIYIFNAIHTNTDLSQNPMLCAADTYVHSALTMEKFYMHKYVD